jgi:NAD(P)H dehydrogenase (quinone)
VKLHNLGFWLTFHSPAIDTSIPEITPDALKEFDGKFSAPCCSQLRRSGILFGAPTRYGRAVAQVSQFFDQTGGLWASGALTGKTGGVFSGSFVFFFR